MPSKERRKKAGKTSRDLAVVAIIVLVVIASAGLFQAMRERVAGSTSTSQLVGAMTGSGSGRIEGPNDVVFEESSDRLPADANTKLAVIAETARVEGKGLTLAVQVEDVPGALELARRRADAVRHALQANGIPAGSIRSQITATSRGAGSPQRLDRVIIVLR